MSTVSKHILNEIADKLDNKKDDFQMQIEKLEALSDKELQELALYVDWYESLEDPENITTAEKEKFSKKYDEYIKSQK